MSSQNFCAHRCDRIRRHLDAYLSNELLVETTNEVVRHLEVCESCAQELETRTRLRDALRRAVRTEVPPDDLIEVVHRRLTKAKPLALRGIRARKWASALAGLAITLVIGVAAHQWFSVQRGRRIVANVLRLGVGDHLYCAIRNHGYQDEGRPHAELRERLWPAYDSLLALVEERLPSFHVLEAHNCHGPERNRNYVHFIASGRGAILSVILTKRNGASLPTRKSLVAAVSSGVKLYEEHLDGMSVAGFEANDYFGFVVSDGAQSEMLDLAARLAPAVRSALPSIAAVMETEQGWELEAAMLTDAGARGLWHIGGGHFRAGSLVADIAGLGVACRLTRNSEEAEDVVQDAFLKAFRNLDRFRGDSLLVPG